MAVCGGHCLVTRYRWGITFESFPIWLMVLNPDVVSELHIRGYENSSTVKANVPLIIQNLIIKIGFCKVKYVGTSYTNVDIESLC